MARNNSGTYSYEYTLTDHLGNNRTTIYKNPNGSLEVLQRDDYFAFGLRRGTQAASNDNKYLYNRKELQEKLGEYDYGARFYDPVIAWWTTSWRCNIVFVGAGEVKVAVNSLRGAKVADEAGQIAKVVDDVADATGFGPKADPIRMQGLGLKEIWQGRQKEKAR